MIPSVGAAEKWRGYMVKKKEELKVRQHKHRSEIKASGGKEQCAQRVDCVAECSVCANASAQVHV